MLKCDLKLEQTAHATVKEGIAYCESVGYVSREILVDILTDTEEHIEYLETQLDLIDKVGLQNCLQSQMEPASSKPPAHRAVPGGIAASVWNGLLTVLIRFSSSSSILRQHIAPIRRTRRGGDHRQGRRVDGR